MNIVNYIDMIHSHVVNVTCILVLLCLILGLFFQRKANDPVSKKFAVLIFATIGFVLVDALSEAFDGNKNAVIFLKVFNLLSFLCIDLIFLAFNFYIRSVMFQGSFDKFKKVSFANYFIILARVVAVLVLFFTGTLFKIKDGVYESGSLAFLPYIFTSISLVCSILVIAFNKKTFTTRQFIAIFVYHLLPVAALVIEAVTKNYSITSIALTLSVLLIYLLAQDTIIEHGRIKQSMLEELSNKDMLTGVNNRRAFFSFVEKLHNEVGIGLMYCDLNDLKRVNDSEGHSKGDELIVKFSKIITSIIDKKYVYRISGDEFIIAIKDIDEERFKSLYTQLRNRMIANQRIGAIGYAYGLGKEGKTLVRQAERMMYEDKAMSKASRVNESAW